ncbi:MAG: transcriptional regulator [Spirochaetaceae bacterium]|jgi:hypothetical protein|nr:transcriptional regulator [Spirochaetaceae bacterium]
MDHSAIVKAHEDFTWARGKEMFNRLQFFMNPEKEKLLSFNDVKNLVRPKGEAYWGMRVVPIRLIVGSEGRYKDFNKYFLPKSDHVRARWESVDRAYIKDVILPPIQLCEIGGVYFVRDGNHRVSVAKTQGVEMIDAEVTSLTSDIELNPNMTVEELRGIVIAREKETFYENTNFGVLTGCHDLDFSRTGLYDVIYRHIQKHNYYLNKNNSKEIPFPDAVVSWYKNVYMPIVQIIHDLNLRSQFPKRTPSDLYIWIVKHWDDLKQKYGDDFSPQEAACDFTLKFGKKKRFLQWLHKTFGRKN